MHAKEFVRFRIKKQLEHPGVVAEHHALCQLRVLRDSHLVGDSIRRQCFLGLANHGDFWNGVNPVREKVGHVFKGNSKHMTGREPALFHGGACKCRKADNVPSRVDVRNVSLKELVHFEPAAGVSRQSSSFQMELIAIGLAAHSVDECVASYFLAALQFRKDMIAYRVDPYVPHLFPQPKSDT